MEQAQAKIVQLRDELNEHNHKYYVLNTPTISDYDFDQKMKELQTLEEQHPEFSDNNSPTKRVGGEITKNFEVVAHRYPMLSLSNTYSKEEIMEWEQRIKKKIDTDVTYVCELKYDGVAISLLYQDGQLTQALTRGNGAEGEDITNNVRTIKSIPLTLHNDYPEELIIRGEIYFPLEAFEALNRQRVEQGENTFANPRNTASGTLKLQDSSVVAQRGLDCFLYGIHGIDAFNAHFEAIQKAKSWGFKVPSQEKKMISQAKSINEITEFINYWEQKRFELPLEVDGVVIKVNDYEDQENLGYTAKSPRWAIAYKYETERVETILEDVVFQVGRTGAVTPVAVLQAVQLGGTTVKRASLYNADQIKNLNIHYGDSVQVEKGGEIIPKIVGVNTESRKQNAALINFMDKCPECNTLLEQPEGEAHHFCPNRNLCPPQVKGRIEHFASRKAMDIDGVGSETVDLLVENNIIQTYADLYTLQFEDIIKLDRMAEKSVNNLLKGIEISKQQPFERVMFAIGIRYVGATVAKTLVKSFGHIDAIIAASIDDLVLVEEIGEKIAESVYNYFQVDENRALIDRLKSYGLNFEAEQNENQSNVLKDERFVVSGVFNSLSRNELKKLIETNGGKIVNSVSSNTDYLVAGANMGPAKKEKAEKLNVNILSEEEFLSRIR